MTDQEVNLKKFFPSSPRFQPNVIVRRVLNNKERIDSSLSTRVLRTGWFKRIFTAETNLTAMDRDRPSQFTSEVQTGSV